MPNDYFSNKQRVRAILLTGKQRNTIVFLKSDELHGRDPGEGPYWITPGGMVNDNDTNEQEALRRELRTQLGFEINIIEHALQLFMARWNIYLCRLTGVDKNHWKKENNPPTHFELVEVKLEEQALRQINIYPRAVLDYLLANLDKLRR